MSGLTCNACNKEFIDNSEQKLHYKSEWHRYNLKHKEKALDESCLECGASRWAENKHSKSDSSKDHFDADEMMMKWSVIQMIDQRRERKKLQRPYNGSL